MNSINSILQKIKSLQLIILTSLLLVIIATIWVYKKEIKALENTANIFVQQIEALKGQIFIFKQLITLILENPAEPEALISKNYIYSLDYDAFINSNGSKLHNELYKIFSQSHSWLSASDLLYFKLFDSKTVISDLPINRFHAGESEIARVFSKEYCFKYMVCSKYSSEENLSDGFIFSDIHSSINTNRKTLAIISPSVVNGNIIAESHIDINLAQWESHADKYIASKREGEYLNITVSTHPERSRFSWKITTKVDNFVTVTFERHYGPLVGQAILFFLFVVSFIAVITFYYDEINTHSKTKYESMIDALTGCFNRKMLESSILKKMMAEKDKSAVIAIDGNKIKFINDKYGHGTGDIAIVTIANAIKNSFRKEDVVIRTGGDEFVVIAFGLEVNVAYYILGAVNDKLKHSPVIDDEIVSVAAGVASCQSFYDLKKAISDADVLLYQNKKSRNEQREFIPE